MRSRPSVFVGSSSEGLSVAEAVQVLLDYSCEVTLWSQGVFGLGKGTLEALVDAIERFDFAILVLTPDDLVQSRGETQSSARDNVLFELGLFMGALGRRRTFILYDRTVGLKLPSDLAGVTCATFAPHSNGKLDSALGAPCTQIKGTIEELGLRETQRLERLEAAADGVRTAEGQMQRIMRLMARSRAVELEIISKQFGPLMARADLERMRQDLADLEESLKSTNVSD